MQGDRVRLTTNKGVFEGRLLPEDKEHLILKLDSGYNIGIAKANVKKTEILEKNLPRSPKQTSTPAHDSGKPTIAILHTGGTIASRVDYETGAVYAGFSPEELLELFPELRTIANISSRLVANMVSEDMRFSHYNLLAKAVSEEIEKGCNGIIITHGTDTLHITAAALSFMVQKPPVPVLIVGAQRSSDRGSSDAGVNLICAANFIAKSGFAGVAVCMHETSSDDSCIVIPGTGARKMHSSKRDAFKAVNQKPIARISYPEGIVQWMRSDSRTKENRQPELTLLNEKLKIGLLKTHVNMYAREFTAFRGFDGLIIEGTGLGHAPISESDYLTAEHGKIWEAVQELAREMPVVMATQTIYGEVDMNVYSPGRRLLATGVLGNYCSMTAETAFIKLAWLLSNKPEEAKKLFGKNIAGELGEGE